MTAREAKAGHLVDLRTERPECLAIGSTHLSQESSPWKWNGTDRWWQVFVTITGYSGAGGYWVREEWKWNGNGQAVYTNIRTLSHAESRALEADVAALEER